jgi:hypothetical protein
MELWVACDKSATKLFPLLLDYSPGFPPGLLDPLVLPKREQLNRLANVEDYLNRRRSRATEEPPWVSYVNGLISDKCFAARYYNKSPLHQSIHYSIVKRAKTKKANKLNELKNRRQKYHELLREYETSSHLSERCPGGRVQWPERRRIDPWERRWIDPREQHRVGSPELRWADSPERRQIDP